MKSIEDEILKAIYTLRVDKSVPSHPLILCFVTGQSLPRSAVPMPLDPAPPVGALFDRSFISILKAAMVINSAAHDGAIMLKRTNKSSMYHVAGWSYRLASSVAPKLGMKNRGSAYNSCLAMSYEPGVDFVALSSTHGWEFFDGPDHPPII